MPSSPIFFKSYYQPRRGGHAPGDIRAALFEAVEAYEIWEDNTPEPVIEIRGQSLPISRVCGMLWNCTDIMPWLTCSALELRHGSTYAQGARHLKSLIY